MMFSYACVCVCVCGVYVHANLQRLPFFFLFEESSLYIHPCAKSELNDQQKYMETLYFDLFYFSYQVFHLLFVHVRNLTRFFCGPFKRFYNVKD